MKRTQWMGLGVLLGAVSLTACESMNKADSSGPFSIPGYATKVEDDSLYVVSTDDKEHYDELMDTGEIEKPITAIGAEKGGYKVKAPDEDTLYGFLGWD